MANRMEGLSEVLGPLALRISFAFFFLLSPVSFCSRILLSYLSSPLLPSSSPNHKLPCWLLNPFSSSFLLCLSSWQALSPTSPVPHHYPLLFLPFIFSPLHPNLVSASLISSISHSPASSSPFVPILQAPLFLPLQLLLLLPSLSSSPAPLSC